MNGLSRSIRPTISFPIQKDHHNLLNLKKPLIHSNDKGIGNK
jgi:hypothetical protein